MFIVLEGCDKCGKTTLANKLSRRLGIEIVKFSAPTGDPYVEYMDFLLRRGTPAILDRFYLGELVYGPIKRGEARLSTWQRRNIEELLAMRNSLCVYAHTNVEAIAEKFIEDGETFLLESDIVPVLRKYEDSIDSSGLRWHRYNYNDERTMNAIEQHIERWSRVNKDHASTLDWLRYLRTKGGFNAKVLFVGDIVNDFTDPFEYRRFMLPFMNGGSAENLYSAIEEKGYAIKDYALTNATKVHLPPEEQYLLWHELLLPNLEYVVCLGNKAYEVVRELQFKLKGDKEADRVFSRIKVISAPHQSHTQQLIDLLKELP
jgi:thymidylate kinase